MARHDADRMGEPNRKNQTVWTADNPDVLRGMHSECVDLIRLDSPPSMLRDWLTATA
ncbi:MAG: hypothetical protein OXH99_06570 [Bryobacterales bacterium]|nr:hypothetical protein [Bryobacterales bacterium]